MGADYIPEKDYKAAVWMKNFALHLRNDPSGYRTSAEDAEQIDELVLAFRTANAKTWDRSEMTLLLAREKNLARKAAERAIRPAYQRIRTDPKIADLLKLRAGVKPTAKRRQHVGPPITRPQLFLDSDTSGRMLIRVRDLGSNRRGKPREAAGFELFQRIRPLAVWQAMREQGIDSEAADAIELAKLSISLGEVPTGWQYVGYFTAAPIVLAPPIAEMGDEVSLIVRWTNRKGEPGPFGQVVKCMPQFDPMRNVGNAPSVVRREAVPV
jgi:hypothetical protein